MAIKNYTYQIKDLEKDWENTPVKTVAFDSRKDAVTFAYNLSYMLEGVEIRLTEGNPKTESATYIRM